PSRPSFSSLPPPPTSPLFPYTTLFRSQGVTLALGGDGLHPAGEGVIHQTAFRQSILYFFQFQGGDLINQAHLRRVMVQYVKLFLDRKSTRLNSSHVSISYAVFCLKKKK